MSRKILENGDLNAITSQIIDLYDSQDWGMTEAEFLTQVKKELSKEMDDWIIEAEFLTQVKKELSKEMDDWIIEARYNDQEDFERDLPDYVNSVKVHFHQLDFRGNRWILKPRIEIEKESRYVHEMVVKYLQDKFDYNPTNGDWFEYISAEGAS